MAAANSSNLHSNSRCHLQSSSAAAVVSDRSLEQLNEITCKDEVRQMLSQQQCSTISTFGDSTPKHRHLQHPSIARSDSGLSHLCEPRGKVLPRDRVMFPSKPGTQIPTESTDTLHRLTWVLQYRSGVDNIWDRLGQILKTRRMVQSREKYRGLDLLGILSSRLRMSRKWSRIPLSLWRWSVVMAVSQLQSC